MKKKLLSTIVTIASMTAMVQAQRDTRVITTVRDGSGRLVQGVSLKFFGPFGVANRRSDFSTFTGRNGESEKSMMPGRYLVIASDPDRGIDTRNFDVSERSSTSTVDLRLHTTRRPTIQFVVMSDDRNEPVSNANIEIVNRDTGRRDSIRSRGSGVTQYELANALDGGKFDVRISSPDFDTMNMNLGFRPGSDTSSLVAYTQLRLKTGTRRGDDRAPIRGLAQLDGLIRLSNKNRLEAGDVASINVGLLLSKVRDLKGSAISNVKVTNPNGVVILSDTHNVRLSLNEYVNSTYDVSTRVSGLYTVTVSAILANGSGVDNARWDGRFSFTVHGQSNDRGRTEVVADRGTYIGSADMEMDNRDIKGFNLSLTLSKGSRGNLDNVKGWLSPRSGNGFHMMFDGTFDQNSGRLDARGTMTDREDKRWDIRVSGSPDRYGKLGVRLTVRALDNSYNRSFDFTLARK